MKKEKEKEIEFLKLCLKAKREAELLSLKVSSSKNTSMLGGKGLVQKNFPLPRPDLVEVAQQTEIDGVIVHTLAEPKDLLESGKFELVEEVAVMVEEFDGEPAPTTPSSPLTTSCPPPTRRPLHPSGRCW